MKCPDCGADISTVFASAGGSARAASLSKRRRKAIAALGGTAAAGRSAREIEATRLKRSEAMRASWARRKLSGA